MISIGRNIASSADELSKAPLHYLASAISNPKPAIEAKIRQLRVVRRVSPEQYAALKRQLSYFTCATFSPPFRKTANFAHTVHFVVDIDHLGAKGIDAASLRSRLLPTSEWNCSSPRRAATALR